jgi:ribosomal protein S18 acetylase RimI-like enzyme
MPIYAEAFPPSERRSEKQLKRLIKENDSMYFNLVLFEGKIAGLFVYWNLADFFFLEHLAISPDMRNHKIGQQVLDWIADNLNGIRLMEVEPSGSSEFASRRIAYYERNGYKILNKNYQQPSYSNKNISYPMRIMGNQEVAELNSYIDKIIIKVYTKYYA